MLPSLVYPKFGAGSFTVNVIVVDDDPAELFAYTV